MTIRTRFAPSPTGFLHVGGARTALYCWLFARKMHGEFILRIEDTDLERSTEEAKKAILEAMEWLELKWDDGPYYQTQRFDRYREVAEQLLQTGHAYRCYCSKERLEKLREDQLINKEKPRYDGHCRMISFHNPKEPYVIRFRNPDEGEVLIDDCVRGRVIIKNAELDDLIIFRSDGTPTYNFTVVVDDWDMQITHVIRGDDHLNNTPRQINILKALGADLPLYAHIPMILGSDGKRLSKRHGAVSVQQYWEDGILPEALLNYLVRLGWSHGDQEIFTREEMIQYFDIHDINKAPAAFNTEKLLWLNQHYIKTGDPSLLESHLLWQFKQLNIDINKGPTLQEILAVQKERVKTLKEMAEKSRFFYEELVSLPFDLCEKHITEEIITPLEVLQKAFREISVFNWQADAIHKVLEETANRFGLKIGKLAQPLRVLVTGGTVSPPIDITLQLLGQKRTIERLERFKDLNNQKRMATF